MYQLLIFTHVLVPMKLPHFVITHFRVVMSRSIMSAHKISQFMELLALIIFLGMLDLNIIFLIEIIFGNSDWADDLRWNAGNGVSVSYSVLLIVGFVSICLMLRLATTPLRYAKIQLNAHVLNWDMSEVVLNPLVDGEESHVTETVADEDASFQADEPKLALARSLEYPEVSFASFRPDLPETVMEHDPQGNALKKNHYVAPSVSTSDSGTI